jgi:hypothetical protein
MSASPVKLPAILSGAQTKVDGSVKLTFSTRELDGTDSAALFGLANKECWLLIAPDDSLDSVDVPKAKPDSGTGQKTPGQRLRAVIFVYWKQAGAQGDFEEYYRQRLERLIEQFKAKLDGVEA